MKQSIEQTPSLRLSALMILIAVTFQSCGRRLSSQYLEQSSVDNTGNVALFNNRQSLTGELTPAKYGPQVIQINRTVLGSDLRIQAHSNFAYAIFSLQFRGQEFINYTDHGRELQSASSFDDLGECFNPTEAGSRDDGGIESPGTSEALGYYAVGNTLATKTNMAFWLHAGQPYNDQPQCGNRKDLHRALNTADRGGHIFEKNVTIGFAGIENVIDYNVTYHVPESHQKATFEALTGYMPPEFDHFFTYDPNSKSLLQIMTASQPIPDGEQPLPLILATENSQSAMGVYSPELPQASVAGAGYGHFSFIGNTNKWNCVFREQNLPANSTYKYRCFVIVGTLAEVQAGMDRLHAVFHPTAPTAASAPAPASTPVTCSLSYSSWNDCQPNGTQSREIISRLPMGCTAGVSETIKSCVYSQQPTLQKTEFKVVHRFYLGSIDDHFFALNYQEGISNNYSYEGIGFNVVASGDSAATVNLYRCRQYINSRHFLSAFANCEGQISESVLGQAYPAPGPGLVPLYRLYNGNVHFATTSEAELKAVGYHVEGILGYVKP